MDNSALVEQPRPARPWFALGLIGGLVLVLAVLPFPFLEKLRVLSAGVCAQRVGHSILFDGVQPPLESRMIGIYGGFMTVIVYAWLTGRGRAMRLPSVWMLVLGAIFVGLMGVDGVNALLWDLRLPNLYPPDNTLRLVTGTLCGIAVGLFILPVANFTVWRNGDDRQLIAGWPGFVGLLVAQAMFIGLVRSGLGPLLYPVSIYSVAGIALLVLMVNLLMVLAFTRKESLASSWLDLAPSAGVALCLMLVELLTLAGFRFWAEYTLGITPL